MGKELELVNNHIENMNEIVLEHLKGRTPTQIAKEKHLTRQQVQDYIDEWRVLVSNNVSISERARDALSGADLHFSELIAKAYEVIEGSDLTGNLNAKTNGIKLILDIEAKRIDMFQRAGVLNDKELANQYAEMEKRYDAMKAILNTLLCDPCKHKVLTELRQGIVMDA